jgi:hypothetical protein
MGRKISEAEKKGNVLVILSLGQYATLLEFKLQ